MKFLTRVLTRYWGYIALVLAVGGFFLHALGLAVILVLSLGALGYFLFQAPLSCGAETRKGEPCRNNSHGLLIGCYFRQHKWQRLRQIFSPEGGQVILRSMQSASGKLGTLSGAVAGIQFLIVAGILVFHHI
jgi:hypothetical protein